MKKSNWVIVFIFVLLLGGLWVQSTSWFRLRLANFYEDKGNQKKAINIYQKVFRKEQIKTRDNLENSRLNKIELYKINKRLGDYWFNLENKNKAITHYEILKKLNPEKVENYINLYILNQQPKKLVDIVLKIQDIKNKLPKDYLTSPLWRFHLAKGLAEGDKWRESEGIFKKLVKEYPYLESFKDCLESVKNKKVPQEEFPIIGMWNFDEGSGEILKDFSGMENDGEIKGAEWVEGVNGYALRFDGEDDTVVIPDSESMHLDGQDFTIAMWVKPVPQGKHRFVYHKWRPNLYLGKNDKTWSFAVQDDQGNKVLRIKHSIENKSYFVVQRVKQGKEHKAWLFDRQGLIDSVSREDIGITKGSDKKKFKLSRKGWHSEGNAWFKGDVGKVYLFSQALNNREIKKLYDSSKGKR